MKGDKFQIYEVEKEQNHAGTKAVRDVADIAEEVGFKKEYVYMNDTHHGIIHKGVRQARFAHDWSKALDDITDNSIVLLQFPFHTPQLTREKTLRELKKYKHVKYICFIHDIQELRSNTLSKYYEHEFKLMLEIGDVYVVHNAEMEGFLRTKGIKSNNMVQLGVFDYLTDVEYKQPMYDTSVTIAGNLDENKSKYIKDLGEVGTQFYLYGTHFTDHHIEKVTYCGVKTPEELPSQLQVGFGLVWDGDSINTCSGEFGNYLRFNNPHKLSLYLASGLPIMIWKDAAEADYVMRKKIGVTLGSLKDIPEIIQDMPRKDYYRIEENVEKEAKRVRSGYYTKEALNKCLKILK